MHQRDELHFAYRYSSIDELVILRASFALEREDRTELTKRMQTLWIVKKSKQPSSDENVGRVFKNPLGLRAADLIEQAGLKGTKVGGAEISDHPRQFHRRSTRNHQRRRPASDRFGPQPGPRADRGRTGNRYRDLVDKRPD